MIALEMECGSIFLKASQTPNTSLSFDLRGSQQVYVILHRRKSPASLFLLLVRRAGRAASVALYYGYADVANSCCLGVTTYFSAIQIFGQVTSDGQHVLCQCSGAVNVVNCSTGLVTRSLQHEDDMELSTFILSPDDKILVVATSNLVLRQWNWVEPAVVRTWKAVHTARVASMAFDKTSTLLASGGADATIKVWDVVRQYCTNNLRGHSGVVSIVRFHPDSSRLLLLAADDRYEVRVWSLESSTSVAVLRGHYSAVTAIEFTPDGEEMYSGGRDRTVLVWNMHDYSRKHTVAVNESIESLILLPNDKDNSSLGVEMQDCHFLIAGDSGTLKVWNTSGLVYPKLKIEASNCIAQVHNIRSAAYNAAIDTVSLVTNEDTLLFYQRVGLVLYKQFVGHNDEVVDIKFWGQNDRQIVVATNSPLIKIFDVDTWACQILAGHTDNVVTLDTYQKGHTSLLVSGSKDNMVRLWSADNAEVRCIAMGYGHAHTVMAVALSRLSSSFLVSGGLDCTIKVWSLPSPDSTVDIKTPLPLQSALVQKAHDKEIQSLAVSPNDKLIASGSRDKKAKLWNAADLSLVCVLSGHSGGVWCVQFSPVDQCLATASADNTVKMWYLKDFTCIRTFQGHDCSVLKLRFLARGQQLLTSDSGGIMKLWNVKASECTKSFEAYDSDSAIWALAIDTHETWLATGSSTSTIILWKDVTEEEVRAEHEKKAGLMLKEQELSNLLQEKKYSKALALAITLEQPLRVLNISKDILELSGESDLKSAINKLRDDQTNSLVKFSTKWVTNGRHAYVTTFILQTILQRYTPDELDALPDFRKSLDGLLVYVERHFERHCRMVERASFVSYVEECVNQIEYIG